MGPYHQFNDSVSAAPEDVCNTPMASFQGVSYQADFSGSLGLPTQGIDVHTEYSSHAVQSQPQGSRSSCFSSPMTHVNYPSQTDGTMITTSSTNAVCCTTPLSQEQVLIDYFDSHISSSPVHANVSTTASSFIYTNDHLQFDSQSTSVQSGSLHSTSIQSGSLHSHEHARIHEEKCNLECKKSCSESNSSTTNIFSNNADNSLHASSSKHSTSTNRMYEFTQPMKIAAENGLQLATGRPKQKLIQMFGELQKELNEQFKEMHDNITQFMKMHEAEKHKANQLQKNIISENNDIRDNIPFSPTTIGSDVFKPY